MARLLTWKAGRLCNGQVYYLVAEGSKWTIAKFIDNGEPHYVLYEGNTRHPDRGWYDTSQKAMDVADELAKRQQ